MRAAMAVVAAVMLLASPATAQRGYDIDNVAVQRVTPTPRFRAVWDSVVACAGVQPQPGGGYDDIVWLIGNVTERDPKHEVVAAWIRPDTIVLDEAVLSWPTDVRLPVAAHEMLHHLLRLAVPAAEQHPTTPFYQPCQLMQEQFLSRDPNYKSPWRGWEGRKP